MGKAGTFPGAVAFIEDLSVAHLRSRLAALRFHARAWVLRRRFKPYVIHRQVENLDFDFYVGDPESQIWNDLEASDGGWEEMRFVLRELVAPGDVVFDCGAHHGTTAVLFALRAGPTGRVVAFEPHPHNVRVIEENLRLNRLSTVTIEPKAIGARPQTVQLRDRSNAAVAFGRRRGFPVDMTTLDDYARAAGVAPTFVKIDVEGYEADVLQGAARVLEGLPKLAIELHPRALPRYGSSVEQLLERLPVDRYDLWLLDNDAGPVRPFIPGARLDVERAHLFGRPKTPGPGAIR